MRVSRTSLGARPGYVLFLVFPFIFGFEACQRNPSETPPKTIPSERPYLSSLLDVDTIPPRARLKRTTILNTLADKFNYQSYLEVGQGRKQDNFDWVTCRKKVGVDPNPRVKAAFAVTSDEFFAVNHDSFGLIFVDGLHLADQVERDILNSLKALKEGGTIVVHDCNPTTEDMQIVPWQGQHAWTGDVWKAWVRLRASRADLKMCVVDIETGCGIIRRGTQETIELPERLTYDLFEKNRTTWLNLLDVAEFLKDLKSAT